jgi:hypothetical protein
MITKGNKSYLEAQMVLSRFGTSNPKSDLSSLLGIKGLSTMYCSQLTLAKLSHVVMIDK